MGVQFKLLGKFELVLDGQSVPLRGNKARALLVVLLLHANRAVSTERLIEALWGSRAPAAARQTVQYFVHQLRRALGADAAKRYLITQPGGYLLRVGDGELDADRFELLLREA